MRIAVLGPLEILDDDGAPVAVPGAKERLLLALLAAASPDVVSTDRIVETLWNGDRPASARKSLQVHLVHLRSALEPDRPRGATDGCVVRRGNGYALTTAPDDVDALRVGDLVARGRARLTSGEPAEAVLLLSAALGLWRGEPYGDWPDALFADAERRRLTEVRAGARTTLLEARLALGEDAEVVAEAERMLADDPLKEEWWRLLVLALYRSGRQGDALAAVARARAVLVEQLGAEPGPRLRAAEAAVLAQDPALDLPRPRPPPDVAICPYKGLAPYQSVDAGLFHGRDRVVARLVGRLVDAPLLVVSGASGAGKSSLVRAGLIPTLAAGALPGSEAWRPVVVTPGRRPTDALTALTGNTAPSASVLLVCDQFEELWAPGVETTERTEFLDTLLELLDDGRVARCVAVVRGDHVGRLAEHAGFTEHLGAVLVLVPPLTDDELREVVRAPAATVGLAADTELLDAVVADVAGRPAALPLLSTALVGTWERRRGDRLTLAGYLEAGRVSGALARAAEAAFTGLDEDGRTAARRLFMRLADADEGGALVRPPLALTELDLDDGARRATVDAFVGRRLLVIDDGVLDVAHEALLTAWPRLVRWLEDDIAGRAVRRHLVPAARDWERRGEPDDDLYRGARLGAALDWADGAEGDVAPVEQRFLAASRARSDAELTDARHQLRREVAARRRTRRLAAGLAAVLVVALVATVLAVAAQRAAERSSVLAERQSTVADAHRLAVQSATAPTLDLSVLLAAQAVRLARTPETEDGLLSTLVAHHPAVRAVHFSGAAQVSRLGNAGRTLFLSVGLEILSWEPESRAGPQLFLEIPEGGFEGFRAAAASPTEELMAFTGATEDGLWLRLVDDAGTRVVPGLAAIDGEPFAMEFTADGRLLDALVATPTADGGSDWRLVRIDPDDGTGRETAVGGTLPDEPGQLHGRFARGRETAVLWTSSEDDPTVLVDLVTGDQVPLARPARDAGVDSYRALSSGAAVLWDDGAAALFDRSGAPVQELAVAGGSVRDIVLAPDGSWAATVGDGASVVLWDVDPATGWWSERGSLLGHRGDVLHAAIDPAGEHLFTVSLDDTAIAWDVVPDAGFGAVYPDGWDGWVANSPAVVEPGAVVVVPTRPVSRLGGELPFLNGDTLPVVATFIDPRTGEVLAEVPVGDAVDGYPMSVSVAVSADRGLVAVTTGRVAAILDARTREVVERLVPLPAAIVNTAAWTPDGARLLIGTDGGDLEDADGGEILVYDATSWQLERRLDIGVSPSVIEVSPDERWLAVGAVGSGQVVVLDADSLDERSRLELARNDFPYDVSFSGDGRRMAAAGDSGALYIADTDSWELRAPVTVHDTRVLQVEWLRDDRTVVTASLDRTVALVDVDRDLVRGSTLHSTDKLGYLTHVLPEPTGDLIVLGADRIFRRYPTDPSDWLREACAIAGRDMTEAEWAQYLPGRPWQATCSDLG